VAEEKGTFDSGDYSKVSDSLPNLSELVSLKGQTAIVTGAARGIGGRTAYRLAEAGANVVCVDILADVLEANVKSIKEAGFEAVAFVADLGKIDELDLIVEFAVKTYGGVDILANIAAISPVEPVLFLTEPVWDKVFDVNLKAPVFLAQAVAKQMIKQGRGGKIINCSSQDIIRPAGFIDAYDTCKGALAMATKVLAKSLAAFGIRVNTIAPGATATPGGADCASRVGPWIEKLTDRQKQINLSPPAWIIDNGRVSDPDEQARGVLFLACDLSSYVLGSRLDVNGGFPLGG